jgi:hypothetical protein
MNITATQYDKCCTEGWLKPVGSSGRKFLYKLPNKKTVKQIKQKLANKMPKKFNNTKEVQYAT